MTSLTCDVLQVARLLSDQRVKHVMNAVSALGWGLHAAKDEFCEDKFPCSFLRNAKYATKVGNSVCERESETTPLSSTYFILKKTRMVKPRLVESFSDVFAPLFAGVGQHQVAGGHSSLP